MYRICVDRKRKWARKEKERGKTQLVRQNPQRDNRPSSYHSTVSREHKVAALYPPHCLCLAIRKLLSVLCACVFVRARACVCDLRVCMCACVCIVAFRYLRFLVSQNSFDGRCSNERERTSANERGVTIQRFFPTFCVRVFFCISFLLLADFCEKSNSSSRIGRIYLASFAPFYAPIDRRLHYGWLMITVVDIDDTDKNIGKTNEWRERKKKKSCKKYHWHPEIRNFFDLNIRLAYNDLIKIIFNEYIFKIS